MKLNRTHATRWQPRHVLKHAIPIPLGERARSADGDNDDVVCRLLHALHTIALAVSATVISSPFSAAVCARSAWDIMTHNEHDRP